MTTVLALSERMMLSEVSIRLMLSPTVTVKLSSLSRKAWRLFHVPRSDQPMSAGIVYTFCAFSRMA